jgi:energy-coupling factor transporter transmembrane protein EcfT
MLDLIFASKNEKTASAFYRYVKNLKKENDEGCFFSLHSNGQNSFSFKNFNEILIHFEKIALQKVCETLIILDYSSLYDEFQNLFIGNDLSPLGKLFLTYPELNIWIFREGPKDLPLFGRDDEPINKYHFIVKNLQEILEFGISLKSSCQMFDPSGVRNYIKKKLIEDKIKFTENNFIKLHNSREKKLALCIDEEQRHSFFWAYSLYNFGYSTLPVCSAKELNEINNYCAKKNKSGYDECLIIRDYDLQFPDIKEPDLKDGGDEVEPLYKFRGIYHDKQSNEYKLIPDFWETFYSRGTKESTFIYIISQLQESCDIKNHDEPIIAKKKLIEKLQKSKKRKFNADQFNKYGMTLFSDERNNRKIPILKGLSKEIEGMFDLLNIEEIKKAFKKSRDSAQVSKKRQDKDAHSIPAVNGRLSKKLINRSNSAFKNEMYMSSALLASEALEILNGLSMSLSLEALFLKERAEAYLELGVVGIGNFKDVIKERIRDIKRQIIRLTQSNVEAEKNARMQIFNELRRIYEEHEQFDVAEIMYDEVIKAELEIKDIQYLDIKHDKKNKFHLWRTFLSQNPYTWATLVLLILFGVNFFYNPPWYSLVFTVFIIFVLIFLNKRNLYLIIGSGSNFWRFIISFLIINFIFFGVYALNHPMRPLGKNPAFTVNTAFYTVISSLMNEPLKLYETNGTPENEELRTTSSNEENDVNESKKVQTVIYDVGMVDLIGLYSIVVLHILISIFFLGVLIAALYRWFTRR